MMSSRFGRDTWTLLGFVALGFALAVPAWAQDYRTKSGDNSRTGRGTVQATTVVAETVWNNAGRGFLRWWDPIFEAGSEVDNGDAGTVAFGGWIDPAPPGASSIGLAAGFISDASNEPPYFAAVTSTSGGFGTDPSLGSTARYEWQIGSLIPGSEYEVEVNIPIGPTNITPGSLTTDNRFLPRFQLFRVTDATGSRFFWVDTVNSAGGWAPVDVSLRFRATAAGRIDVETFNVVRRNEFGTVLDPNDAPGVDVVYADAVRAVSRGPRGQAEAQASPVVARLVNAPFLGGPIQFAQRVVSARNEEVLLSSQNRRFSLGVVSSFTHNGAVVDPTTPLRRNMAWSWPGVRPFDLSTGESQRYALEREAWLEGAPNSNFPRWRVFRQADNLSAATTLTGSFGTSSGLDSVGPNYAQAPASAVVGGSVQWRPTARTGQDYFIDVYLPNDDAPGTHVSVATYQVLQGSTVVATLTLNQDVVPQSGAPRNGWVRLPNQPAGGFAHTDLNPLSVRLLDTGSPTDVTQGRQVFADAVRFVGDADLSITSTPVKASADVAVGATVATRDVVVVARENGRIYCMDAHGDLGSGEQPRVYWVWPSEDPSTDPNAAPTEDWEGIGEVPTHFDLSSAAVARVGGVDLLFIGTQSGRVHAIEMTGRGDGTTRRRWTYPDDFNPSNPTAPLGATTLGPVEGSVTVTTVAGTPAVIVPDANGRVIALDAAGDPATRTTTALWQYPLPANPPLGRLEMTVATTPAGAGAQAVFGYEPSANPGTGAVAALDLNTGTLNWTQEFRLDGTTRFGRFRSASPAVVVGAAGAPDRLYFVDSGGFITSLDLAGAVEWEERSALSGSLASLSFAYMRVRNPAGTGFLNAHPTVLVSSAAGALIGYSADPSYLNAAGNRLVWGFFLERDPRRASVASLAVGGWPNAAGLLANRTHIYAQDNEGRVYAFSSEADVNTPFITPGVPPGNQTANPGDPSQDLLNSMIQQDDVLILRPSEYATLLRQARAGTLSYSDLTAARANAVERRRFEYGETLHLMVMDINEPNVTAAGSYFVEVSVTSGNRQARPAVMQLTPVSGAPTQDEGGVAFLNFGLQATGGNTVPPGAVSVQVSARVGGRGGVRGTPVAISTTPATPVQGEIVLNNPLGLRFVNVLGTNEAGVSTSLTGFSVEGNLPPGYSGVGAPWNRWTSGVSQPLAATAAPGLVLGSRAGDVDAASHGGSARGNMQVFDRSLSFLLLGERGGLPVRGLPNVQVNPADLSWQPVTIPVSNAADAGVYKPLPAAYANFEDLPTQFPNQSLDYPDLNRSRLRIAKEAGGNVENPLYSGVSLRPPSVTTAIRTAYDGADYEQGMSGRTLVATPMTVEWGVPRFQPATLTGSARPFGYVGNQVIYVEASGRSGFDPDDPARSFTLGTSVAVDERLSTDTKTLDLGSTPAGGGFTNNVGAFTRPGFPWQAENPGDRLFRPYHAEYRTGLNAQFQQFSVFNEGNVNLWEVRMSKGFGELTGVVERVRTLELFSPANHELSWLEGQFSLFTDLDPGINPMERALGSGAAVGLQKARPGDVAPTRLSTNPRRRQNSNLGVESGFLLDPTRFPGGDPYLGVAVPVGTPVGAYIRQVFPFEDRGFTGNQVLGFSVDPSTGALAQEPYADPGFTLKFNVRETRLTARPTTKAAPMVENQQGNDPGFGWSSRQPAGMRAITGELLVAFSSNRSTLSGLPEPNPSGFTAGLTASRLPWHIYVSSLRPGATGASSSSPLNDLLQFIPRGAGDAWFTGMDVFPGSAWNSIWSLRPGEALAEPFDVTSARFSHPAFPSSGFVNPLELPGAARSNRLFYMAFVGDTMVRGTTGEVRPQSQVFLAPLGFGGSGTVGLRSVAGAVNGYVPLPETSTIKGEPSLVQAGQDDATVFYVGRSGGGADLYTATFSGSTGVWSRVRALNLGAQFDDLGTPSAILRPYRLTSPFTVADVFFTGKVKGRRNAEAFRGQLLTERTGQVTEIEPWRTFEDRFDRLEFDAVSGTYWAPGVNWRMNDADVNNFQLLIQQGNVLQPLAANRDPAADPTNGPVDRSRRVIDREAREMVFDGLRGGKVYVDAQSGSIRLSGAILPRNAQLYVQYSPRFLRVSGTQSAFRIEDGAVGRTARANVSVAANYRGVSAVFDDRMIGARAGVLPAWSLTEDANFWFDSVGQVLPPSATVRHDRVWLTSNRTSGDGSTASRPFMSSMRFGVDLPAAIAMRSNGTPVALTVTLAGGPPSGPFETSYQLDPANGRVYFMSSLEDTVVRVSYTGVDVNGRLIPNLNVEATVGLIQETPESAVPIEQVGSDGDIWVSVDPVGFDNPVFNRRPSLLWMFWSSSRAGVPDIYFQTVSPRTTPSLRRP